VRVVDPPDDRENIVTSSKHLRSRLIRAMLLVLAVATFAALAPTTIGGATSYVTTTGISMEPRFHTGDMAVVRRSGHYRVGDVVAYHSTELHAVVMHRIIARHGGRYVLQGDNNDFIDPDRPGRDRLIGKLWLRVPRLGAASDGLHTPAVTALLTAVAAALLLFLGNGRRRRRRDRRRNGPTPSPRGDPTVARPSPRINAHHLLAAAAVAGLVFLALAVVAFTRPATSAVAAGTPYSERVSFSYDAHAPKGPVYPGGMVKTNDPVFLRLVHRVRVTLGYRLSADAPHRVTGTVKVVARLTSPTGWSHSVALSARTPFTGDRARSVVTLDLSRLRSMVDRLETLTGAAPGAGYTLAVVPRVKLTGTLAGAPLTSAFAPALRFQVDALQMKPVGNSGSAAAKAHDLTPSRKGSVATPSSAANELGVGGRGLPVATARWIALAGLLLAAAGALLGRLPRLRRPSDPAAKVQARYEHLIVSISGMTPNPSHTAIDVTSIDALAQLADRSERLILHHHHADVDTYLVDDEGTLYRYQAKARRAA
jgi:signal peptidase I